MSIEKHYSPRQAARESGLPVTAIYEACRTKELGHVKIGEQGNIWIPESELQAWRDRHFVPADVEQAQPAALPTPKPSRVRVARRETSNYEDLLPPKSKRVFSVQ